MAQVRLQAVQDIDISDLTVPHHAEVNLSDLVGGVYRLGGAKEHHPHVR